MKRYRERMSGACLLLRRKEFFNLAELLENAAPPSNRAFHKPESSHSRRPIHHLMAIFAYNSQGPLPSCPIHSL